MCAVRMERSCRLAARASHRGTGRTVRQSTRFSRRRRRKTKTALPKKPLFGAFRASFALSWPLSFGKTPAASLPPLGAPRAAWCCDAESAPSVWFTENRMKWHLECPSSHRNDPICEHYRFSLLFGRFAQTSSCGGEVNLSWSARSLVEFADSRAGGCYLGIFQPGPFGQGLSSLPFWSCGVYSDPSVGTGCQP